LYTQRAKFHLNNIKENETDFKKEWKKLTIHIAISSIRTFEENIKDETEENI
jgi:hypothetical protein